MATTTTPTPDQEAAAFAEAMDHFARSWYRARVRLRHEAGLSMAQFHLLEPLLDAPDGALAVGELAQLAGVSAPTATRMVDGLVRDGLCARTRATEDRRCVKVSLTPDGRRAADERLARNAERRRNVFSTLTPAERRDAARLLERLATAIEEVR